MIETGALATSDDTADDWVVADIVRQQERVKPLPGWLQRIDRWGTRWGDFINPILVKETRQSLKSRQFMATFSLLLFASLVWTLIGSLQQMPQIYYMPSAKTLVIGYYFLLAVPMLLVVPLAAYRSLEGEVDDGTLELLTITSLSPLQIVLGKLGSAALQMLLYFIVLIPCLAYAYTLRGVELSSLATLLVMLMLSGLSLTSLALVLSPVSPGRMGQTVLMLVMLAILLFVEYWLAYFAVHEIQYGGSGEPRLLFVIFGSAILFFGSLSWLLLVATAAKLTPASENRSTRIRLAALGHVFCVLLVAGFWFFKAIQQQTHIDEHMLGIVGAGGYLMIFWLVAGAMMCSESSVLTARVRRDLPASFVGRALATWLTPGPATGFTFVVAASFASVGSLLLLLRFEVVRLNSISASEFQSLVHLTLLALSYIALGLIGTRLIMSFLTRGRAVKVQVGLAALALTALLMVLVPYGIELVLRDYRQLSYSAWQTTNWAWTLSRAMARQSDTVTLVLVTTCAATAFLLHLLLLGRRVLPQRLLTPERVLAEYRRLSGLTAVTEDEPTSDPLGLDDPVKPNAISE